MSTLWLQEQELREIIEFRKVHGLKNFGDLMTKNVPRDVMAKHIEGLNCEWRDGRAQAAA